MAFKHPIDLRIQILNPQPKTWPHSLQSYLFSLFGQDGRCEQWQLPEEIPLFYVLILHPLQEEVVCSFVGASTRCNHQQPTCSSHTNDQHSSHRAMSLSLSMWQEVPCCTVVDSRTHGSSLWFTFLSQNLVFLEGPIFADAAVLICSEEVTLLCGHG
jgi:hypothetical protein